MVCAFGVYNERLLGCIIRACGGVSLEQFGVYNKNLLGYQGTKGTGEGTMDKGQGTINKKRDKGQGPK